MDLKEVTVYKYFLKINQILNQLLRLLSFKEINSFCKKEENWRVFFSIWFHIFNPIFSWSFLEGTLVCNISFLMICWVFKQLPSYLVVPLSLFFSLRVFNM